MFDHGREQSPLHVVNAWASEQGLVLGQRCVGGKSNEITATPELLDQFVLENSIVVLDPMACQTAIAEKILARGGDYLLTLKGNHPWRTRPSSSTSTSDASAVAHPTVPIATPSTTRMAAWCGVGCSPAPMLRALAP